MICLRLLYTSIFSNPTYALASTIEVYSHCLSARPCRSYPINFRAIWYWETPRSRLIQGVTTHVSASKSSTNLITALKQNMDTIRSSPSLLRIFVIILHTALAFARFRTTSGH